MQQLYVLINQPFIYSFGWLFKLQYLNYNIFAFYNMFERKLLSATGFSTQQNITETFPKL